MKAHKAVLTRALTAGALAPRVCTYAPNPARQIRCRPRRLPALSLVVGHTETILAPGHCIGFTANSEIGHMLVNRTEKPVRVLEIGDRESGDECHYPRADFGPLTH